MSDDIFDFGFTAVTEDELQSVESSRNQVEEMQEKLKQVDNKAKRLYDAITPLLDNLRKNSEKEYILWPNRKPTIDAFEEKLLSILRDGDQ